VVFSLFAKIPIETSTVKTGEECMNWLKKIIYMTFPDLATNDYYCQKQMQPLTNL
jgi:hypothetical protein